MSSSLSVELAEKLVLGEALSHLQHYELIDHWGQGEFHHDVILKVSDDYYVISTNCNGGIKEVLHYDGMPQRDSLWAWRCDESRPTPDGLVDFSRTVHWFPPVELLGEDARSEILPEFRERQEGGGWKMKEVCDANRPPNVLG